jgi:hypothetical protein
MHCSSFLSSLASQQTNKLHGLSPRANYTDRATAACRWSHCQLLRIKGARGQRDGSLRPYFRFSRQEPLQVAPQLYSRGWVYPVPDPLLFFGSAGNRTRDPGSVAKNSYWPPSGSNISNVLRAFFSDITTQRFVQLKQKPFQFSLSTRSTDMSSKFIGCGLSGLVSHCKA